MLEVMKGMFSVVAVVVVYFLQSFHVFQTVEMTAQVLKVDLLDLK